uniref:Putative conserved plasma membrane protein n=1 Tax=Nyssomyia neivai TaxID=330878 RepID=A0A1L8D9Y8_9DIPT
MSLKTRSLVFVTFLGNFVVVGLLVAAFTSDRWVEADAKRHNSNESAGRINLGLFTGTKELNVGYGARKHDISVPQLINAEPDLMSYWLWLGTALGGGLALFSSTIGGIAAVLKSASRRKRRGTVVLLFVANIASVLSHLIAFACWLAQFLIHLQNNVLSRDDQRQTWYTDGLARLGLSFHILILGIAIIVINIICLIVAVYLERREHRVTTEPLCDEKTQGVIMLY